MMLQIVMIIKATIFYKTVIYYDNIGFQLFNAGPSIVNIINIFQTTYLFSIFVSYREKDFDSAFT